MFTSAELILSLAITSSLLITPSPSAASTLASWLPFAARCSQSVGVTIGRQGKRMLWRRLVSLSGCGRERIGLVLTFICTSSTVTNVISPA